ncbi:YihY/virulence factor BrkB family protein [Rubellimicrobium roseum]|uniref:YihY/virulence factor BrkB family protein n=1 Tax=Rubellimicrobium roseum TaxID=687525 RepID=A0A5C4NHN8_9RHOB|nr:YihY/virulence factor BrkB family protein [Rubellimicrobium roseum]TNC73385.1 YihY/virulence factor BrkB family protein [Rubellimicrobium roseum]
MSDAPANATRRSGSSDRQGRGWWKLLVNVYKEMTEDHVGLIAAGVAFYGLLAIFPGIVAGMAVAGLVMDPDTVVSQLEGLSRFLPQEATQIVIDQAIAVAGSESGGLGLAALFGVLVALYSASKGVTSLMEGLNVAFEVEDKRGIVRYYLTAFGLTIGLIVGFLLIVAILALLPVILSFLQFGDLTQTVVRILRWPIVLAILALGLAVLYRYAPDRGPVPWHWITPGAGAACILWLIGSILFAVYVQNFGGYNETFGALGGVIILLTWLWLSAYIVLMGAEMDDEIERQDKAAGEAAEPVRAAKAVTPGQQ